MQSAIRYLYRLKSAKEQSPSTNRFVGGNDLQHFRYQYPVLTWRFPMQAILLMALLMIPIFTWSELYNPIVLKKLALSRKEDWASIVAGMTTIVLLLVPLLWVVKSRIVDIFALCLSQNALLMGGYFFLPTTAFRMGRLGEAIERTGALVVLLNAIGFTVLLLAMGVTYLVAKRVQARIGSLPAQPEVCDARLIWLLRLAGLLVMAVLAFPMAMSGTIPLLAADAAQARFAMVQSDTARAAYHAGTAILPFITGGLVMFIIRNPLRLLGIDGWIALMILVIQTLTSNRLPIAITLFVILSLITVEKRWPRPLLMLTFGGFLLFFTFLTGFTSILRENRGQLEQKNVIVSSLSQAFLGDNLIDVRDASWVFSQWDYEPLLGKTYLGGLVAMIPSGIFPMKKEWHLGLTAIRIVGWDPEEHFGLRITFFGESFLNFGLAGVIGLATILGIIFGTLLRALHLIAEKRPSCLHWSLRTVMLMQMCLPLTNTSDAFTFWAILAFLILQWFFVDFLLPFSPHSYSYAPHRA